MLTASLDSSRDIWLTGIIRKVLELPEESEMV